MPRSAIEMIILYQFMIDRIALINLQKGKGRPKNELVGSTQVLATNQDQLMKRAASALDRIGLIICGTTHLQIAWDIIPGTTL